jgi:hypothetical protein
MFLALDTMYENGIKDGCVTYQSYADIRSLISAPEVKRVSVTMKWVDETTRIVRSCAFSDGFKAGPKRYLIERLREAGVEVVDGGKPEVDAEVTRCEVEK